MDNLQLAQRARIGVLVPATNTGVEYDLQQFSFQNVTWHVSRFWVPIPNWGTAGEEEGDGVDNAFERFLVSIRPELPPSIKSVMAGDLHHVLLGMSAETFWGGKEGNIEFERRIVESMEEAKALTPQGDMTIDRPVGLTTGAGAIVEALNVFGAKKVAVINPYPDVGGDNVRQFFEDMGFEVGKIKCLGRANAWAIAETPIPTVLDAIKEVDADDVDAIVQAGTNLSTVDIFPALEHLLQKPLLPINIASMWHALRACRINDRVHGKGRLLEEF